jgi:hypothetical protein
MRMLNKKDLSEFQAGLLPDIPQENAPYVRYAENASFDPTGVRPGEGQLLAILPQSGLKEVLGLLSQEIDQGEWVFWGDDDKIYVKRWPTGSIATLGDNYALDPLTQVWSFAAWGTWTAATNGLGPILLRKGLDTQFLPIATSPDDILILVRRGPFMIGLAATVSYWCSLDDIEDWTPIPENSAGDLPFRDADSEVSTGIEWNGEIAVATQNSLHYLGFVGAPNWFSQRKLLSGIGATGRKAMCTANGMLYGFGNKGAWRSDGASFEYIDTPKVKEFWFEEIETVFLRKVVVTYDRLNEKVLYFWPPLLASTNQACMAYSTRYQNWQFYRYGRSSQDFGDILQSQLYGGPDGGIYEQTAIPQPPGAATVARTFRIATSRLEVNIGYGRGKYGRGPYGGRIVVT